MYFYSDFLLQLEIFKIYIDSELPPLRSCFSLASTLFLLNIAFYFLICIYKNMTSMYFRLSCVILYFIPYTYLYLLPTVILLIIMLLIT